jgi:putative NADPH-quinone reductase
MTAIADPRSSINSSVYDISPGATSTDVRELLEVKLMHLEAMLVMTWGVGGEAFRKQGVTVQDNYLWACSALASECGRLSELLGAISSESKGAQP